MKLGIGLSWESLDEGFLQLDSSGKLYASRAVTAGDREQRTITLKSISQEVEATLETRQETVIQIGGDSTFCKEINAFYMLDMSRHGIEAEPFSVEEYFTPSDQESESTLRESQNDAFEFIPLFAIYDKKGIAHLMLSYEKHQDDNEKLISLTFEVDQVYTSPSFEGQAFDVDLHVAAGYVIQSIIRANFIELPEGFCLKVVQVYEIGPEESWQDRLDRLSEQERNTFFEMMGSSLRWVELDSVIDEAIGETFFDLEEDSNGKYKHSHRRENFNEFWLVGSAAAMQSREMRRFWHKTNLH